MMKRIGYYLFVYIDFLLDTSQDNTDSFLSPTLLYSTHINSTLHTPDKYYSFFRDDKFVCIFCLVCSIHIVHVFLTSKLSYYAHTESIFQSYYYYYYYYYKCVYLLLLR